ncbi:MAG: hypothetical protein KGL29_02630 [Alphaproteobacteria bacterium]|nr:hypothetical protein [Alphaproteobacteria bacterium]
MGLQPRVCLPRITSAPDFNALARRYDWPILCDASCTFTYLKLRELLALWRELAAVGNIPYRREMTARRLQPYLKAIAIYERVDGEDGFPRYRVRFMGSDVVSLTGELTGKFLDEVIPQTFLPRWCAMNEVTLGYAGPLRLLIRCDTFGNGYIVAEHLNVPLRAEDGTMNLILSAGYFDRTHAWTEAEALEYQRLGMPWTQVPPGG